MATRGIYNWRIIILVVGGLFNLGVNSSGLSSFLYFKDEALSTKTLVSHGKGLHDVAPLEMNTLIPENYDWIPQNVSIGNKMPSCRGPLNRSEIIHTLHQPPWNDMGELEKPTCGYYKCFLKSKSNPDLGYVMAPPFLFTGMTMAHGVQQNLSKSIMGTHILTIPKQPPQLMDIPNSMACLLVENFGLNIHRRKILHANQIVVYPMKHAPEPSLLLGVVERKQSQFQQWPQFMKENNANVTTAYKQLVVEFAKMEQALDQYPQLFCDWQTLTDIQGNLYHMDVDRMFTPIYRDLCGKKKQEANKKLYKQQIPLFMESAKNAARDYEEGKGIFVA